MKFSPVEPTRFYCLQKDFPITFETDKDGEVSELVAFNIDVWKKVR